MCRRALPRRPRPSPPEYGVRQLCCRFFSAVRSTMRDSMLCEVQLHSADASIHHAARANFFGSQAVERRRLYSQHCQIQINLPAVMDFVFGHEAKPFPGGDSRIVGSFAFALEVFVGELRENFHRLRMQAFDKGHHVFVAVGEFLAVSGVARGTALHVFGPHVALRDGEMPQNDRRA